MSERDIEIAVHLDDGGEFGHVRAEGIRVEDDGLGTVKLTFRTDGSLTGVSATVTADGERAAHEWDAA